MAHGLVAALGAIRRAFARIDLPLAPSPDRARLVADSENKDAYIRNRARAWLALIDSGKPLPTTVSYPLSVIRIGRDLTFFFLAGEPVADYALRLKRELSADNPWTIGYAFEVPCYIPTMRIIREGGYEGETSLIYYGIYGPLLGKTETMILEKFREMAGATR